MSGDLKKILEAVLLASDAPLSVARLQGLFERGAQPSAEQIKRALGELRDDCEARGVELGRIGNGYRYQSRPQYAEWIRKLHATRPPKLSRALLETLAIIAYRQPVTRGDIEDIRGVGVTPEIVRRLLERGWIAEVGVRDLPGHPALFATTREFLSYFNLESLRDLPPLAPEREFGEIAAELDAPLPPELLAALRDSAGQTGAPAEAGAAGTTPEATPPQVEPAAETTEPAEPAEPAEFMEPAESGDSPQPAPAETGREDSSNAPGVS